MHSYSDSYSGKGEIKFANDDVYEGEFQDGKPHGVGKMTYGDEWLPEEMWGDKGKSYEGDFKDDKRNGKGILRRPDGSVEYDGGWKDNKKHGKGIWKRPDGSVDYDGEWIDGRPDGNGTEYCKNGDVYTGEFRADKRNGKGVMKYANQDIYDGEWEEDLKDGTGTMTYHNGDVYKGEFSDDKMHGKGVMEYAAGDMLKSIGEWKDGEKCGLFEDITRPISKQVYYDNDEVKPDPKVKLEELYDEDTDTEEKPPCKRHKDVNVSP